MNKMYIKITKDYMLRGWKGASCGLVKRSTGGAAFFTPAQYKLLMLANGVTPVDEALLGEKDRESLDKFIEKGFVEKLEAPSPVESVQTYRIFDNRYVRSLLWSVTGRCNFKCRHCYMDAPCGELGEISHEDAVALINEIADCGIYDIALTGGEPLIRRDIRELISLITEKGIRISQIYTNGWLVNADLLDYLSGLGQRPEFNMSFDGIGWHDWMRGIPGAEKRVLDAIKLCKAKGFPTGVEACMHRKSISSLRETVKLMGSLDTHIKAGSVMNTPLWLENSEGNSLTDKEYFDAMLDYIPVFFEDGMPANLTLGSVIKLRKGSTDFRIIPEKFDGSEQVAEHRMCGAARMAGYISPDARLLPCMPMLSWDGHTVFPKIRETGLKAALTDGFYMQFVNGKICELFEKNKKCGSCEYRLRCGGGCRATALEKENNLWGSDTMQCFFWKNGYVDRIRAVTEEAIKKYCK